MISSSSEQQNLKIVEKIINLPSSESRPQLELCTKFQVLKPFDEVTAHDVKFIAYILQLFLRVAAEMRVKIPKMSARQLAIVLMAFGKLRRWRV